MTSALIRLMVASDTSKANARVTPGIRVCRIRRRIASRSRFDSFFHVLFMEGSYRPSAFRASLSSAFLRISC